MHEHLPPLHTLQGLFHYDPFTGEITLLKYQGPKKPGASAIASVKNKPRIYIGGTTGRYYPAGQVAWYLHHSVDPAWNEEHVVPIDGRPFNLQLRNLELSDQPFLYSTACTATRLKRLSELGVNKVGGKWRAKIRVDGNYASLGVFENKYEALIARREALRSLEESGAIPENNRQRKYEEPRRIAPKPSRDTRLAHNTKARIIKNSLIEPDNTGFVIDDFDHRGGIFGAMPIGKMFWAFDRWWMKTGKFVAWTCDNTQNDWRRFAHRTRVRIPRHLTPLSSASRE